LFYRRSVTTIAVPKHSHEFVSHHSSHPFDAVHLHL